jgi:hypothetical protein
MEGIDLGRLNPISFERLVRALCFAKLGPGGTVYSAGPDGGRDFTYDGAIKSYETKNWSGYLVIQAKFKDPSLEGTDDIKWLAEQLKDEFNKFSHPGAGFRKPDYYILVTNVRLSGADGVSRKKPAKVRRGGMSKVVDLFGPWKQKLKLKDFDIWPRDKIVDLLAGEPDIRQSYAHWITAGDVLSKALQQFQSKAPNFGEVTSRALKTTLQRDQFVRLKDAGSVGDLQIRTSQVIVDLPLQNTSQGLAYRKVTEEGAHYYVEEEEDALNAIAELVERAREKLDPETLLGDEEGSDRNSSLQCRNRIVLMGGPGQGKSTVSLFLTQLFRDATIKDQAALRRDQPAKRLVTEIVKRAQGEGISVFFRLGSRCISLYPGLRMLSVGPVSVVIVRHHFSPTSRQS